MIPLIAVPTTGGAVDLPSVGGGVAGAALAITLWGLKLFISGAIEPGTRCQEERKARIAAEERERAKDDRVYSTLATLDKAMTQIEQLNGLLNELRKRETKDQQ
jgi:hypothetical protein